MKVMLLLLFMLPVGAFAADMCSTTEYTVVESGNCPAGYVEFGTIEDSCATGTKEVGTITEYTTYGSDSKGSFSCSI
jgi:hypothetical protein